MTPTAALAAVLLAASVAPAPLALPDGAGGIGFDDLRFSDELHELIVPAGRTGRVDLVDPATRAIESVDGFSRSAPRGRGHGRGTTSADAGRGMIFAIDRDDVATVGAGQRSARCWRSRSRRGRSRRTPTAR